MDSAVSTLDDGVDVATWVETQLSRLLQTPAGSSEGDICVTQLTPEAERGIAALDQQLQTAQWEANLELDATMQHIIETVPSLSSEMGTVLAESKELGKSLDEIGDHISAVIYSVSADANENRNGKSSELGKARAEDDMDSKQTPKQGLSLALAYTDEKDPVGKLLKLETLRANIEATSQKLSNHAVWNKTVRGVRKRLRQSDLLPAANMLSQLKLTSEALKQLPGEESRTETLASMRTEFDRMIASGLQSALNGENLSKLSEFAEIFSVLGDEDAFEKAYVDARCQSLAKGWDTKWIEAVQHGELKEVQHYRLGTRHGHGSTAIKVGRKSDTLISAYRSWLRSCFEMINASIRRELKDNLPRLFGATYGPACVLPKIVSGFFSTLDLFAATGGEESWLHLPLSEVFVLRDDTLVFMQGLADIFEQQRHLIASASPADAKRCQTVDSLMVLAAQSPLHMFSKHYENYGEIESSTLASSLGAVFSGCYEEDSSWLQPTKIDTVSDRRERPFRKEFENFVDMLADGLSQLLVECKASMKRCSLLSKGVEMPKLVQALQQVQLDLFERISTTITYFANCQDKWLSQVKSDANDSIGGADGSVSVGLRLVNTIGRYQAAIADFEVELSAWMQQQSSAILSHSSTRKISENFDVAEVHVNYLKSRSTDKIQSCVASAKAGSLLTGPLSKCAECSRAAIRLAYNLTLAPAELLLSRIPLMDLWAADEEDDSMPTGEQLEYVSVDDIDGQLEYATALGDLMVDLVQTLEQPLSQGGQQVFSQCRLSKSEALYLIEAEWDAAAVALNLRRDEYVSDALFIDISGNSEADGNSGDDKSGDDQWLSLSSLGLVARFVRQILNIPHLSARGSAQLAVDISYVMNITSAMGVSASPLLQHLRSLLEISKEELSDLADEIDRASAPRRHYPAKGVEVGDDKKTPPKKLVSHIAKKRGILTTF